MEKIAHEKSCANCKKDFPIYKKDLEFYELFEVPEPTFCYACRNQRRLSFRNERYLYQRKCDLTGREMISSFSPDKPFPVYDNDEWWSDKWDPLDYGREFDFNRPFFEQFFELRELVPRLARQQQKPMYNSDYCNCASQSKNCYLVFSTNRCEDCYYGSWVNECEDCIDGLNIFNCELCYECTYCTGCYDLRYSQNCTNCKSSCFLRDCIGCMNCFACSNLKNKQYYIFNEKKTKEEYDAFMASIDLGSRKIMNDGKEKAQEMLSDSIAKEFRGTNIENSTGDYLTNCKNAFMTFESNNMEDCRYCFCVSSAKNCMDYSHWGEKAERIYEVHAAGYDLFNLKFCTLCWSGCNDLMYCDQCFSSKNNFGCIGLKKQEYCIFNKKYSKEEYEALRDKIIEHMKETKEFGEFFPAKYGCFAYNESIAYERYPLTKEEAIAKGFPWKEKDPKEYLPQKFEVPDDISKVDDSIIEEVLACKECGKNYKIIEPELNFYKRQTVPVPDLCPDCRHFARTTFRKPFLLFDRHCAKCNKEIQTTIAKDQPDTVYCEACYLEAVM
jgi:hypothetical protein